MDICCLKIASNLKKQNVNVKGIMQNLFQTTLLGGLLKQHRKGEHDRKFWSIFHAGSNLMKADSCQWFFQTFC